MTVVCHAHILVLAQVISFGACGSGPHKPGLEQTKLIVHIPGPQFTSWLFLSRHGPKCAIHRPDATLFHTNKPKNTAVVTAKTTTDAIHFGDTDI